MKSATVFLVDDEPKLRRALERLLTGEGFVVESFGSSSDFLDRVSGTAVGCVILDVAMPEVDGLEVQSRLAESSASLSIVFLTGRGDIPMSVRAMRGGAVDFLTKPVRGEQLLAAVRTGLANAKALDAQRKAGLQLRARFAQLTPREIEVFGQVISGRLNKVIADRLGISERTIKVHRGRVMEKLGVDSVAGLVRAAQELGVTPAP
jgi:FixJ family two-component response regulator